MRWLFVLALLGCSKVTEPLDTPAIDAGADGAIEPKDAGSADDAGDAIDAEPIADATAIADAGATEDATADDSGVVSDGGTDDAGVDSGVETYGPYEQNGAETFTAFDIDITSSAGNTFTEHVHLPDSAGPHPVVLFAPGTQQPASSYVPYYQRLASHGMIVLARDDPGPFTNTQELVGDLIYLATEWLPAQNAAASSAFFGKLDLSRIGATGHSRGGKATLLAAETGLPAVAYFGIDTVDVTFIDDGVYAITNIASIGIPTAFLVAEVPSNCSPANASGEVLYNAAPSPSVMLTGIGAGHTDFAMPCVLCGVCSPDGTTDPAVVFAYSLRYVTAFFARELLGDATVGAAFEGAGAGLDGAAGLIRIQSK